MPSFPTGFLWGSATAAHQVEGGNHNNDWWDWEHDPASPAVESSGDAIDHLHRYDDDFALLASLGQNAHRLSLEWSRIEPAPGEFSQAALDHYARVLDSLATHGLTAFVTLHHFTLPRWFAARGGWLADDALDIFGRYVERVATALGDRIPYACTVNEPQIVALGCYLNGEFPPGHRDIGEAVACNATLAQAHRTAVAALRAASGTPRIGTCLHLPYLEALRPGDEADEGAAAMARAVMVDHHIDDLRAGGDVGDWVGLQYYTRTRVDAVRRCAGHRTAARGLRDDAHGLGGAPGRVRRRCCDGSPTPGCPSSSPRTASRPPTTTQRVRYLDSHLTELDRAMADGVDVRGYLYWSSFDNFEWARGYAPTFGLVGVDRADGLRRVPRRSAHLFGEVARTGDLAPLRQAAPSP